VKPRPADLPDFERPPVIEVVIGAQFSNLEDKLTAAHVGRFWERLKSDYPKAQDAAPLPHVREEAPSLPRATLLNKPPLRRTWLISSDGNWLTQIQGDRFLHNWRTVKDGDAYPHFERCYERFDRAWSEFLSFCADHEFDAPEVDQLEVTYINHVAAGQGWRSLEDIGSVFPDLRWRGRHQYLNTPESVSFDAAFPLASVRGRLHVSIQHGLRTGEPPEAVLVCDLTARGVPEPPVTMRDWIFEARCAIVRAFTDLTADDVHQRWGLKR